MEQLVCFKVDQFIFSEKRSKMVGRKTMYTFIDCGGHLYLLLSSNRFQLSCAKRGSAKPTMLFIPLPSTVDLFLMVVD